MRDVSEIRSRAAADLASMLLRPSMHGIGQCFEHTVRARLSDLAFIDEREDDLAERFRVLERHGLWGPLGAWGVLSGVFGPGDHTDELASVYAQVAFDLGYCASMRTLEGNEWLDLQAAYDWARHATRSRADVEARFGPPSYRNKGQQPRVFAYAGTIEEAWLTFHFDPSGALTWVSLPKTSAGPRFVDLRERPEPSPTPEDAYRNFLISTLYGSESDVRRYLYVRSDPSSLWAGAYPPDVARSLTEQYESMGIIRVSVPDDAVYLVSEAFPVPMPVIRNESEWRVDAEALLAFRQRRADDG